MSSFFHFPPVAMQMSIFQPSDLETKFAALYFLRLNIPLKKGSSGPFQNSKVSPWTVWTFGYLSNCVGAKRSPAATLILTTKTLFNAEASPILAAVISSNTPTPPPKRFVVLRWERRVSKWNGWLVRQDEVSGKRPILSGRTSISAAGTSRLSSLEHTDRNFKEVF